MYTMFWTLNTRHLGCDVTVVLEEIKVSPLLLLVIMGSALLLALGALEMSGSLGAHA